MAAGDRTDSLVAQVRSRINEPSEQGMLDASIIAFLNEAQLDLAVQCNDAALGCLLVEQTAALTLDEAPYALPNDFMRERQVSYKTVGAVRWPVLRLDALSANVHHRPDATNVYYYIWGSSLYLRAGTKTAGDYHLHYHKIPTDCSTTVDPTLGPEFGPLMVTFAVMRCREQADFDESERLWGEYLDGVAAINSRYSGGLPWENIPGDRR